MDMLLVTYADPKQLNAAEPPVVAVSTAISTDSPVLCSDPDPIEDIRVRAETVSLLLKDMMERQPTRHWGINE